MNTKNTRFRPAPEGADLYGRALLAGILSAVVLLFLFSAITMAQKDPARLARPLSLITLYFSAALCGFFAGRAAENKLLAGIISGALYLVLITAVSLFLPHSESAPALSVNIAAHAGVVCAAVLGAWITQKRKKRTAHSHKKRRR